MMMWLWSHAATQNRNRLKDLPLLASSIPDARRNQVCGCLVLWFQSPFWFFFERIPCDISRGEGIPIKTDLNQRELFHLK